MTPQKDPTWRAASNGAGKMRWGVARFAGREWAETPNGKPRRFASHEAAANAAFALNAEDIQAAFVHNLKGARS